MSNSKKNLSVRLNGKPVGLFSQTAEGRMRFKYLLEADQPISVSLPIQTAAYSHKACEAYFAGLLPESSRARQAIALQFNANPNSTYSLLQAIGSDCAGAISFVDPSIPAAQDDFVIIQARPLSSAELAQHIEELPEKPLFLGVDGLRLSLAGVQEKAAICVVQGKICLPLLETPTTHILKPTNEKFPALVPNEYLCLKTAEAIGLAVPAVQMDNAKQHDFLLVERYDRQVDGNQIKRIHQEDFCQALGNRQKYQRFAGPSLKDCFELLMKSSVPVLDRNSLMSAVIFNYLIGNGDAHGKNFSLLHYADGSIRLAPFYDLVSTQIYNNLTPELSMKIGDTYRFRSVRIEDWRSLALKVGFSFPAIRHTIEKQATSIPGSMSEQRETIRNTRFDNPMLDRLVEFVTKNCQRTLSVLAGETEPDPDVQSFSGVMTFSKHGEGSYKLQLVKPLEGPVSQTILNREQASRFLGEVRGSKKIDDSKERYEFDVADIPFSVLRNYGFTGV